MNTPTREELLALSERGFVPQGRWRNRDSAGAQRQLGECYALLKAGCEFTVDLSFDPQNNDRTHWVRVESRGFDYFEGDYDGHGRLDSDLFYVPTADRLDEADGGDWY